MTSESSDAVNDRLTALELSVAHLQHDFDQLHQTLLAVQEDLRLMTSGIRRLADRVDRIGDETEPRSPEEERPPHY